MTAKQNPSKGWIRRTFFSGDTRKERWFSLLFALSMILKGIDGLIELAGGIAFASFEKTEILNFSISVLQQEDVFQISSATIARWTNDLTRLFATNFHTFFSVILIGNGIIKIFLSIFLLMKKYRVFPFALAFLAGLYIYQIVQTVYHPSIFLFILDAFDLLVILVIGKEYLKLRKRKYH